MTSPSTRASVLLAPVLAALALAGAVPALPAHAMETGRAGASIEQYLDISSTGINRLQRRSEEMIAACMKQEGFQYTPTGTPIPKDAVDAISGDRKAFVQKYGYGISTFVEPPKKGAQDPNQTYVNKLSPADQRAYRIALLGFDPQKPDSAPANGMPNAKSCIGRPSERSSATWPS